ncbi:MAG: sulfatase-like hydrolase/transferase [Planctomycetota bacterium]|jgi:arylsulfatase A-like enzyme
MHCLPLLPFVHACALGGLPLDVVDDPDQVAAPQRPNILLLLADDQGWNGTSLEMDPGIEHSRSDLIRTPSLDRLATEGRRYSRAYSSAPTCAPSRAALQTGRTPSNVQWERSGRTFDGEQVTVGDVLREAGYRTAHFGKWHISGGGPGENGYLASDGDVGNEAASQFTAPNPVDIFGMAERASEFITQSAAADEPFFVQLSWLALHSPGNARPETIAEVRQRVGRNSERTIERLALAEDLDEGVGQLLDLLDELELSENTLVIYTSDNGGSVQGERVLRGGKGSLWEGGIRVPFVVRGPGVEAGSLDATPIALHDLFPTFADLAGAGERCPEDLEGTSLAADFCGAAAELERSAGGLLFHLDSTEEGAPEAAIIRDGMKLIRRAGQDPWLVDLEADPGESRNVADEHAEEMESLSAALDAYLEALPESSSAGSPRARGRGRQGRGSQGRGDTDR